MGVVFCHRRRKWKKVEKERLRPIEKEMDMANSDFRGGMSNDASLGTITNGNVTRNHVYGTSMNVVSVDVVEESVSSSSSSGEMEGETGGGI